MATSGKSLYTQARKIGEQTFIISVYDLEPAGLLVRAYNHDNSLEYTLSVLEHELEYGRVVRTEDGLRRLVESIELAEDQGRLFIQSTIVGIPKPKKHLDGTNIKQYLNDLKTGDETLNETLVNGLAELCKVKPTKIEAIRWLGHWLLEHNPDQPQVAEA